MQRLFDEHVLRPAKSLDGLWDLSVQGEALAGKTVKAMVPGVWERIPALCSFRGVADYNRTVELSEDTSVLLRFGGVSHTARVFWDGAFVGQHYNAFTGFEVLIPSAKKGSHRLHVEVDDRYSDESVLHMPNDYMTYGGINRPVEMHLLGNAYITKAHFTSTFDGAWHASVKVSVAALAACAAQSVQVSLAGKVVSAQLTPMHQGETADITLRLDYDLGEITPWQVLSATLYDLLVTLTCDAGPIDDLIDRVGFRTVTLSGEELRINGESVFIKGFNRHEDHGQFGCALDPGAMMDDIQLMLDLGANSVRTSHYPNDPRFLDLCDELGILVWEENHARAIPPERMHHENFMPQCLACIDEMVAQHMNHPSIYIWGILNECESETPFGRGVYAQQFARLRSLDVSRPVTFASCRHFTDISLDLPDVVSFNIYPRWYVDEPVDSYAGRLLAWMDENGAGGKPVIFSEFGAGGIMGFHDMRRAKWSEERQADILAEQLDVLSNHPRVAGLYIWQFSDVRVSDEWFASRPKTQNNKGIVDMYRRPKLAYEVVKNAYHKK